MKKFGRKRLAAFTVLALSLSLTGGVLAANVLGSGINYEVVTAPLDVPEGTAAKLIDATVPIASADGASWKQLLNSRVFSNDGRYLVVEVENLPASMPSVNVGFFRTDITVPADNVQWVKVTSNKAVVFDMGEKARGIQGFVKVNTDEATSTAAGFKVYQTSAVNIGTIPAPVTPVPQTTASDWAKADVAAAQNLGFVPDELQNNYTQNMTRSEFAKLALSFVAMQFGCDLESFPERYHDSPYGENITLKYADIHYTDMATPDRYVWWATMLGIVTGRGDGSFAPNDPISRQEATAMLLRTYKLYGSEAKLRPGQTVDVGDVDNWTRTDASIVASCGIMTGDGNHFNAHANYTREQCIITFLRLYQNMDVSRLNGNITPM